jgi:hypothetical protein
MCRSIKCSAGSLFPAAMESEPPLENDRAGRQRGPQSLRHNPM